MPPILTTEHHQEMAASLCTQTNIEGPLVVYHRITKTSEDFAFKHPNSRATPALTNLVRSADIIWTYLDHEMSINAVYQVLLASDVKGKLFVECSGVLENDYIYALANEAKERGATFLTLPCKFHCMSEVSKLLMLCSKIR